MVKRSVQNIRVVAWALLSIGGVAGAVAVLTGRSDYRDAQTAAVGEAHIDDAGRSKSAGGGESAVRARSQPASVDVPVATIAQDKSDAPAANEVGMADVGAADPLPSRASDSGRLDDNQSDSAIVDAPREPAHAVAPVPMQDAGLAAARVQLAFAGEPAIPLLNPHSRTAQLPGTGEIPARPWPGLAVVQSLVPKSRVALAVVPRGNGSMRRFALAAVTGGMVGEITEAARGQKAEIPLATLGDPPGWFQAASGRAWPTDERPPLDPSALMAVLPPGDSLCIWAGHWVFNGRAEQVGPEASSPGAIDQMIERSAEPWQVLYEMGRVSAVLDVPSQQQMFWRAAILRAGGAPQSSINTDGDVRCMEVLAGTFLWIWRDDALAAGSLRCLLKWGKPGEVGRAKIVLLLADALNRRGREAEAIGPLEEVTSAARAGSVGEWLALRWALARALFHQQRVGEGAAVLSGIVLSIARYIFE